MLAKIRDDTWNVLNMQHIIPNSKIWDHSDIPGGGQISQWVAKLLFSIMSIKNHTFEIIATTSAFQGPMCEGHCCFFVNPSFIGHGIFRQVACPTNNISMKFYQNLECSNSKLKYT